MRKLSVLDIIDAFKEDALPVIKQEIRKNKLEIRKIEKLYKPYYYKAALMEDDFSRIYWTLILDHLKPKAPYEHLKRLETVLFLLTAPKTRGGKGITAYNDMALAIERAKNRNMLDLYAWEKLRKNYTRYTACCPFHTERTPSFTIYTKNNSWYCFSCHQGGNPIDFIMLLKGCDFKEAVKTLS